MFLLIHDRALDGGVDAFKSRVSQDSVHTNAKFALTLTVIYNREFSFGINTGNGDIVLRKLCS